MTSEIVGNSSRRIVVLAYFCSMTLSKRPLYLKIKEILDLARHSVYRSINFTMVTAYWNVGKLIVEEEQKGKNKAEYGTYLMRDLSKKLTRNFGKGFSEQSLWNMRQVYLTFPILSALRRELTWTHYKVLIRIEDSNARGYYVKEASEQNWSVRELERQISTFYYERLLAGRVKTSQGKLNAKTVETKDLIKDPYILEFLSLEPNLGPLEKDLEKALIDKLQSFLLELGKGFAFVGRQKRINTETSCFYIDLVFYNYILKCFVLVDLKIGKLTHQDIGQMDMYVRLYEDRLKNVGDNPTIGIILCTEKDETVVRYSVLKESHNIFASKYKIYLPSEDEIKEEIAREKDLIGRLNKLL